MSWALCLTRTSRTDGMLSVELGHALLDDYLRFVAARVRPNRLLAVACDLRVFFRVVAKEPEQVTTGDVLGFITEQRRPRHGDNVVRLEDGEAGLSARTIKRRFSSVSGLYGYLVARDDVVVKANPVPRGMATRRSSTRRRGVPLLRAPRTLPKLLEPDEVDRLLMRCGPVVTGRWSKRCCWAACAVARSSGCASRMSEPARTGCSSPRARAALSVSSRSRSASSTRWPATWPRSVPRPTPTGCWSCSRDRHAGRRSRLRGERAGLDTVTCHMLRHTCLTRGRAAVLADMGQAADLLGGADPSGPGGCSLTTTPGSSPRPKSWGLRPGDPGAVVDADQDHRRRPGRNHPLHDQRPDLPEGCGAGAGSGEPS